MKKIFVAVLVILSMIMLTGCKNETLEESKNKKTNTELNEKVSDISIKDSKIFEGLDILNDNIRYILSHKNFNKIVDYIK